MSQNKIRVVFSDYHDPDSRLKRGLFGLVRSPIERAGLWREMYEMCFVQYSPAYHNPEVIYSSGRNEMGPEEVLEQAVQSYLESELVVKNKPDVVVIEPAGVGFGDEILYPHFLDLLMKERDYRGVVAWTGVHDFWCPEYDSHLTRGEVIERYLEPLKERGIPTVSKHDDISKLVEEVHDELKRFSICLSHREIYV